MEKNLEEKILKKNLKATLSGEEVFSSPDLILMNVKKENYGKEIAHLPYTLWQLLEHIRIAQNEILLYMLGKELSPREWPSEYWPKEKQPSSKAWQKSIDSFFKDHKDIISLLDKCHLFDQISSQNNDHTFLREFTLIALHNSYHLGQFVCLRRLLNDWPSNS